VATVTGLTAERMIAMENATVISGAVVGSNLILHTKDGGTINAGTVAGPTGPSGGGFTVCTSTTRPTFTSGEAGKAIYETDTKLIRMWTGTAWKLQEKIICTRGTRPVMTVADEGVKIYETNTDLEYTWNGTAWVARGDVAVTVIQYTNAAARTAAMPNPPIGALSYLATTPGTLWIYESGVWNTVGSPPGVMQPFFGTTAPLNWCLMYGQQILNAQTLYPLLWALADPIFKGSAPNLTVPDLRGRIPVGKDNMGGTDATRIGMYNLAGTTLGAVGGDKELQSHGHNTHEVAHAHGVGESLVSSPGDWGMWSGGKAISNATGPALTGITVLAEGSGNSQNIQPSIIMNWILKLL